MMVCPAGVSTNTTGGAVPAVGTTTYPAAAVQGASSLHRSMAAVQQGEQAAAQPSAQDAAEAAETVLAAMAATSGGQKVQQIWVGIAAV